MELSRQNLSVTLIDLEPQADLTKFWLDNQNPGNTITTVLGGKATVWDSLWVLRENLYLLPGTSDLQHFNLKYNERLLRECLEMPSDDGFKVDLVIIDHPPGLTEGSLLGFVAADAVLLVTEAEVFSVSNLDEAQADLSKIKEAHNPNLEVLGIAINKVDRRRSLSYRIVDDIRNRYGDLVLPDEVSDDTAFPESTHNHLPIRELQNYSRNLPVLVNMVTIIKERLENLDGNGRSINR